LCVLIFSNCKNKSSGTSTAKSEKVVPIVDIIIASPETISNVVEANGTVIAEEYVELRPEISGRLTYLNVPEGKNIAKGTIIARVNDADLRAQIAKSKVQLELAQTTVDRYKKLLDINGLNQADYDAAVNQVNSLRADIVYTQALVDKTVIRAPFSGVAGLRGISPGAYVSPSTVIATLQQTNQVKIDFTLPDTYGNIIKKGMLVTVEVDAATKDVRKAIVVATEPGANTDTRNLKVRALLQGGTANPGAFVKVHIDAGQSRTSIKVPTNCIIPDDKNNQVVLVKNGMASFVNIKTGIREASTVEVVQGVKAGDSVVVTGVLFARPKNPVQVRSVKTLHDVSDTSAAK
jgi:membrane fusion protein (multidrug efflux system)